MGPHPKRKLITLKGVIARAPAATTPAAAPAVAPSAPHETAPRRAKARQAADTIAAKARRKLARTEALAWLSDAFPAAFGGDVKLLALGVGRLIWPRAKAAGIRRRALNHALMRRTISPAYLDALAAAGAVRCDLNGRAVEPVSAEHRAGTIAMKAELTEN